jgi:quercetin dioxygenase-like cupin family protein
MTTDNHPGTLTKAMEPLSTLLCDDLDAAIAHYAESGYRLEMIMPADSPRIALLSRDGETLRIEVAGHSDASSARVDTPRDFMIARADTDGGWIVGRAGMRYRDLIPGRLGGHCIASQIRIPDGGPVPDYVHYHKVGFQMIYCRRGWVRVVYEDQGPPFVMHAGDCVLQPPTIRHRVLESSPGLEVIEIGCPAEHETWRDHGLELPTPQICPERRFGGQRFVRHVAAEAVWQRGNDPGIESRDTGIFDATDGLADVRVLRMRDAAMSVRRGASDTPPSDDASLFVHVLEGQCRLQSRTIGDHTLAADDSCVIPATTDCVLATDAGCEILQIILPAIPGAWGS